MTTATMYRSTNNGYLLLARTTTDADALTLVEHIELNGWYRLASPTSDGFTDAEVIWSDGEPRVRQVAWTVRKLTEAEESMVADLDRDDLVDYLDSLEVLTPDAEDLKDRILAVSEGLFDLEDLDDHIEEYGHDQAMAAVIRRLLTALGAESYTIMTTVGDWSSALRRSNGETPEQQFAALRVLRSLMRAC